MNQYIDNTNATFKLDKSELRKVPATMNLTLPLATWEQLKADIQMKQPTQLVAEFNNVIERIIIKARQEFELDKLDLDHIEALIQSTSE